MINNQTTVLNKNTCAKVSNTNKLKNTEKQEPKGRSPIIDVFFQTNRVRFGEGVERPFV